MEIIDLSDAVKNSEFVVFKSALEMGGSVRGIVAKGGAATLTRKEIDKLTEHAKGIGAKGLAWIRLTDDGMASSFGKFVSEEKMQEILTAAAAEKAAASESPVRQGPRALFPEDSPPLRSARQSHLPSKLPAVFRRRPPSRPLPVHRSAGCPDTRPENC